MQPSCNEQTLLESVGIHNWHICESYAPLGGRFRTQYLNNTRRDQDQYQEMGPIRFAVSITYADTHEVLEIMDHRMVPACRCSECPQGQPA